MTMHRHARGLLFALASCALFGASANAQQGIISGLPSPRLYSVFPAGAKAGATIEVVVAGRNLDEPKQLLFSNAAIKGEYVAPAKPEIDPKTKKPKPIIGALPVDNYRFKITVPANTPVGHYDLRVVGKWGASNARTFVVGDLTEVNEKEPNSDVEQAQRIDVNTTVNGTIGSPTDVDYFVVKAKKGQRIVVSCLATTIDSRLQPAIEIYDKDDKQLAANRNYFAYDAVTDFTAEDDGDYYIRLFQFTHAFRPPIPLGMPVGSSDYFYRLSVSTAPWIDAVYPSSIEPGKTATVTVYGRNLPGGKLDPTAVVDDSVLEKVTVKVTAPANGGKIQFTGHVTPPAALLDAFELRLKNTAGSSNPFLLNLAKAPVVVETGDNDTAAKAQSVTLPCEIAGQIEKRRDRDWYTFTAKKGEAWNIEVFSNRLGAPTYMTFLLRNPTTKNDIYEVPLNENMQGYSRKFFSKSEDPRRYRFVVPADGKYQLLVTSRAGDSLYGPRHTYNVRITKDEPDFRLVAQSWASGWPDTPIAYQGGHAAYTILADRRHGFNGDIELSVEGLPAGVTCATQTINGSARQTTLVLSAAATAAEWSGPIKIKGTATIGGKKVTYEALPGAVIWPNQQPQIVTMSRLDRDLMLAVRGKAPYALTPTIDKPTLNQGDKAVVTMKVDRLWPEVKNPMQIQVLLLPGQPNFMLPNNLRFNNNQIVTLNAAQKEGKLNVTVGPDVPPGVYNVVFRGQTNMPYNKDPMSKQKPNTILLQPSAPLTVTVLPKSLATFTISPTNTNVKIGNSVNINVRVVRRFGYSGDFKVSLVLPPNVKGVEAAEATIPGDKNSATLTLKVPADATIGNRPNLIVRAVAMYNGKTAVNHEVKLNVNVIK